MKKMPPKIQTATSDFSSLDHLIVD